MAEPVLVKKYTSRRLYDTQRKTYVTLAQVSDMIKDGRKVEVIDAKTEQDVTAFILTQIIVEEAKNSRPLLPVSLLHLIIECGETVLNEFFDKYLESSIKNYLNYKRTLDEQFKRWLEFGTGLSAFPDQNLSSIPSLRSFLDFFYNEPPKTSDQERNKG